MNNEKRIEQRIDTYLGDVSRFLTSGKPEERQEILDDLRRHILEALQQNAGDQATVEDVEAVIGEMDDPARYAEATDPDGGNSNPSNGSRGDPGRETANAGQQRSNPWFFMSILLVVLFGAIVWQVVHAPRRTLSPVSVVRFSAGKNGMALGRQPIVWRFNSSMVVSDKVDAPPQEDVVVIQPPIDGEFTWTGTRELTFTPEAEWPACRMYQAVLADHLHSIEGQPLGDPRIFEIRTMPLRLLGVEQVNLSSRREVTLKFAFNAHPDLKALSKHLHLRTPDGESVSYDLLGEAISDVLLIKTGSVLSERLEVVLAKGFPPMDGPLGLEHQALRSVRLSARLRLRRIKPFSPSFEPCQLKSYFTSSVKPDEASDFIEVRPDVPFTVAPLNRWEGGGLVLSGGFKPGELYRVTFKEGLPSVNGDVLMEEVVRHVHFPNRTPSLAFTGAGRYLSPRGNASVPVLAVNIKEMEVTAAPIPSPNLVFFAMRNAGRYRRYYGGASRAADKLTGSLAAQTFALKGDLSQEERIYVNLEELLDAPPRGAYLLKASAEKVQASHQLVVVTDLGISARKTRDGLLVWINSLRQAKPVSDAEVALYAENNLELGRGRTDTNGVAFIDFEVNEGDAPPFLVTAKKEDDLSYLSLHDTRVNYSGRLGGRQYLAEGYEAYVFTDRGIYRPGERVHMKALVRDKVLECPESFPVILRVIKPDGRVFKDLPGMLDALGSVEADLVLPEYLPTGGYTIQLVLPGTFKSLGATHIAMEDFVPPQIRVNISKNPERAFSDQSFTFRIAAEHLFGRPASGLLARGRVGFEPAGFAPENWPDYVFGDPEKTFTRKGKEVGKGNLGLNGSITLKVKPNAAWRPPARIKAVLGATVIQASGRAVSAYAKTMLDPYPFYIGIRKTRDANVLKVGEDQHVSVAAVQVSGEPFRPEKPLKVVLSKEQWTTVLKKTGSGRYAYTSEKHLTLVKEDYLVLEDKPLDYSFSLPESGSYELLVSDADSGASTRVRFHAGSPDQEWVDWAKDKPNQVELELDRDTYAPGQTARLLIKAPFKGTALLTIDSDRVLEHRLITLEENTIETDIKIRESFIPNVYCSIALVRPAVAEKVWSAHRAVGSVPLIVHPPDRRLTVEVETPEAVRPQSKLISRIRVNDENGNGIEADVTMMAVDEGICMLTDFQTPDPMSYFLDQRRLGVSLFDMYSLLMPVLEDEVEGAASHVAGGAGILLGGRLNPIRANRFKPVALWVSSIRTDTNGEARVSFDVPEFSGELRVMAVAFDRTRAGSNQEAVKVKRPLIVQTGLPRFLAPGDGCAATVNVFNETGEDQLVRMQVTCGGPLSAELSEKQFTLAAGESRMEEVSLKAGDVPGKALFTIEVTGGPEHYAETIELSVRPSAAATTYSAFGVLGAGEETQVGWPAAWLPETVKQELWCSARPDVKLGGAVDYLLRYPYGCVEQTTSSAFPLLYLADLINRMQPKSVGREEASEYVQAGIYRLLSMQRSTGGFSMWPSHLKVYPWGSLYATHFLVEADKASYRVPKDRLEAALGYLRDRLDHQVITEPDSNNSTWQADMQERAYACHVLALAGRPPRGWIARLREHANLLRVSTRVHVASALMLAGQPREANELLRSAGMAPAQVPRETGGCLNSPTKDVALVLSAWVDVDPQSADVAQWVRRLEDLSVDGRWYTTQDTAMSLMALGKYGHRISDQAKPFKGELLLSGDRKQTFDHAGLFKWSNPEPPGKEPVRLLNQGPGLMYYGMRMEGVPMDGLVEEGDWGLKVRRDWMDSNQNFRPMAEVKQGDLVLVRIQIDTLGRTIDNLVVEELLPAGLEIENPSLATSRIVPWIKEKTQWCIHRDIRDDRLILFTGPMHGVKNYYYAARAVTSGTFVYPSMTASSMYDPETRSVYGRGMLEVVK